MYHEGVEVFQLFSIPNSPLVLLGYGVILSVVSLLIGMYVKMRKCSKSPHSEMPTLMLSNFSITGILAKLPSRSTRKKLSLPITAFLPQLFSGTAVIFPQNKATATRAVFQHLIVLKKAESVEEFLCSYVLITKPFRELLLPLFGPGLFLSSGQRWKSRRKVLNTLFHSDTLKGFLPIFDKEAKVLVEILRRKCHESWIDVKEHASLYSLDSVCKTFLGLNIEAQEKADSKFLNAVSRATQTVVQRMMNPLYRFEIIFGMTSAGRQFKKDINYLREICMQVVKERKAMRKLGKGERGRVATVKSHFIDHYLDYQENHPDRTDENIRDDLLGFIFAGADTTASALSWAFYLIGVYPEIQRKVQDELEDILGCDPEREITEEDLKRMDYIDCVLKECQRLYPSGPFNAKYTLEDCSLAEYKIKKGSIVIIDVFNLHRDPDVFPNPEVFDPDRFRPENCAGRSPYAYVPFSGGVRSCLGKKFSVMETKTVVANVLQQFSLKSIEPRDKIYISCEIVLRSPRPLKVKFIPRNICSVTKISETMC